MQVLIQKIKKVINLSPEAEKHIYSIASMKTIKRGEKLIHQGKAVNKTYFVNDGCLRSFYLDKKGKEHTLQFAIKEWWISDFIAIYNDELASLTVECLKDSQVIEFNPKDLNDIHSLFPEFEPFQRNNLESHVVSLHKRILNQLELNAAERYNLFLKQYPDIEKYTSNYHIASYLGITQQSLSRIRIENTKKLFS